MAAIQVKWYATVNLAQSFVGNRRLYALESLEDLLELLPEDETEVVDIKIERVFATPPV